MRVIFSFCASICAHAVIMFFWYLFIESGATPISTGVVQVRFLDVLITQPDSGGRYGRSAWTDSSATQEHNDFGISERKKQPPKYVQLLSDMYMSRSELSRQPSVLENVDLSILESVFENGKLQFEVDLYLSEYGFVDRVEIIRGDIPSDAITLVKAMLSRIMFTPGEIDDHKVKTKITIEVFSPSQ